MNTDLTAFDLKFLSECGIPVDDEQSNDNDNDRRLSDEMTEAVEYYRRIVEELG